jgi:cytochrome c
MESMLMKIARLALLAAPLAVWAAAAPAQDAAGGDPVAGEKVFKKCAACHSLSPDGKAKVGPDLYGVIGRTTGTSPGFKYSEVMTKAGADGHVWTEEELAIYLESPKAMMPGTKMTFVGLKKPEERADVIAYLATMGGGS